MQIPSDCSARTQGGGSFFVEQLLLTPPVLLVYLPFLLVGGLRDFPLEVSVGLLCTGFSRTFERKLIGKQLVGTFFPICLYRPAKKKKNAGQTVRSS